MPGGTTPGQQSGQQPGQGGQTPGEQPGGSEGDGNGTLEQPTWDPASGGAPGSASTMPSGGQQGGQTGGEQSGGVPGGQQTGGQAGGPGTEDSWETGVPGGAEGGWETSNQLPAGNSNMPPMPSEQGLPPGASGSGTEGGDDELDDALKDFDGEILAEREVIQARSNERAGEGGTSGTLPTGSGSQTSDGGVPGDPGGAQQQTGGYVPRGMPSQHSPQKAPPATKNNVPDDIPDARDDDIIARQLREAAMNETDPELREKLWEEYRRYKGA